MNSHHVDLFGARLVVALVKTERGYDTFTVNINTERGPLNQVAKWLVAGAKNKTICFVADNAKRPVKDLYKLHESFAARKYTKNAITGSVRWLREVPRVGG